MWNMMVTVLFFVAFVEQIVSLQNCNCLFTVDRSRWNFKCCRKWWELYWCNRKVSKSYYLSPSLSSKSTTTTANVPFFLCCCSTRAVSKEWLLNTQHTFRLGTVIPQWIIWLYSGSWTPITEFFVFICSVSFLSMIDSYLHTLHNVAVRVSPCTHMYVCMYHMCSFHRLDIEGFRSIPSNLRYITIRTIRY